MKFNLPNFDREEPRFFLPRSGEVITGPGDWMLSVGPVCMTFFGLVMVYSASLFVAAQQGSADSYYLVRQLAVVAASLGALVFGMKVDPSLYRKYAKILIIATIIVMAGQTAFAPSIKGTKRWLPLPGGFMLQTSEFSRAVAIIYVARLLSDNVALGLKLSKKLLAALIPVGILAVLTYMQRDLSGAAMIAAMVGLVLFLGGLNGKQFWGLTGGATAAGLIFALRTPYQRARLVEFFFPSGSVSGDRYQSFQSMLGFGRGGIFGVGLGEGKQKMLFLPEPHTDFIYSIIGEEMGLIGTTAVLVAFMFLFVRSIKALKQQSDRFSFLMGSSLIASIMMFALVHMAVTTGIVPVTGLPLPFISNGGSSLLVSLWTMGVIWNLSRRGSSFE